LSFFQIKLIVYWIFVFLGIYKSNNTGSKWYLLLSIWGLIDFITNILIRYYFTSNLEILVLNNLLTTIVFLVLSTQILKVDSKLNFLVKVASLFLFILMVFVFYFDVFQAEPYLYSDYGYLNTIEYSQFHFTSSIIGLIFGVVALVRFLMFQENNISVLLLIFGFLSLFLSELIKFSLNTYLLPDLTLHKKYFELCIYNGFFISKGLIIAGLLWKN